MPRLWYAAESLCAPCCEYRRWLIVDVGGGKPEVLGDVEYTFGDMLLGSPDIPRAELTELDLESTEPVGETGSGAV